MEPRGLDLDYQRKSIWEYDPVLQTGKDTVAAGLLWAAICAPCGAQTMSGPRFERLGPNIAESSRGRGDSVGADGRVFPDGTPGIGVTSTPYTRSDGSAATRNGIVGSMAVAPNMELGVGLFSVTRYKGERDFARSEPMRDTGERRNRLAAVGLKLRF